MPVAVITGASQGLGLALASALAERGWSLVLDARRGDLLTSATAGLPGGPHRVVPGDVTDRRTGRRSRVPPRSWAAPTCWSTTRARSGAARCRRSPTSRRRPTPASSGSTSWRRWRWSACSSPSSAGATGGAQHLLRRRGGGLRDLGRLRLREGRPRPRLPRPRGRGAESARLRRRPRRHAHGDAPGRLPRRGHQRPAAARAGVPGLLGLVGGDRRAAGCARPRSRRCRHDVRSRRRRTTAPPCARASSPPEARGLARDEVRLAGGARRDPPPRTARRLPTCSPPATCWSSTPARPCPRPSTSSVTAARGACTSRPSSTTARWVVELRLPDGSGPAVPEPGEVLRLPGGIRLRVLGPTQPTSSGSGGGHAARDRPGGPPLGSRATRSATPTSTAVADHGAAERVRRAARQRRDGERRTVDHRRRRSCG